MARGRQRAPGRSLAPATPARFGRLKPGREEVETAGVGGFSQTARRALGVTPTRWRRLQKEMGDIMDVPQSIDLDEDPIDHVPKGKGMQREYVCRQTVIRNYILAQEKSSISSIHPFQDCNST